MAASSSSYFECWICSDFTSSSMKSVVRHIGCAHSCDPNFRVLCGINQCRRVYTNFSSFRSHLYRKHKEELQYQTRGVAAQDSETSAIDLYDEHQQTSDNEEDFDDDKFKKTLALFLLKTKEVHKVSQAAINGLLVDLTMLFQLYSTKIKLNVFSHMTNTASAISDPLLDMVFDSLQTFDPFAGIHSEYLQEKYYKEELGLLVSFIGICF